MTEKNVKYSMCFAWVNVGDEVNLKNFGFDERFTVLKIYRGRPRPEDTLPGQYDLSNVDPSDECHKFTEEQLQEQHADDMTLVVARKSGDRGIVL